MAAHGEPFRVCIFRFGIWSVPIGYLKREKEEKESKRRGFSMLILSHTIIEHFQQISRILRRFIRGVFLKGNIEGWIGLPDPADTARIGLLSNMISISKDRFKLVVNCVYDREIIRMNGRVQATVIIGYLGLVVLGLILEKDTRLLIRGLSYS